ncbi:MAG: DNA polymerase ligase N-terminal domain-containing protein [Planctomycetota bacterium]|jgi:hypothetical protein
MIVIRIMKTLGKFVIQEHRRGEGRHWDLMLEAGQVLETYRLDMPPAELLTAKATAVRIFDHPPKFLTYEGSVNQGEGSVRIAESGTYQMLTDRPDLRKLRLNGNVLKGTFTLKLIDADTWESSFS